jgi:nitroreductase
MSFNKPVLDIIAERTSRRTYASTPVDQAVKDELLGIGSGITETPFGGSCDLRWVVLEGVDPEEKRKLGTYGFIKGAREFIAGIVKKSDPAGLETLGYVLETVILHATDLGLGTCWLAGFNHTGFGEKARLADDETIAAITPVGHPANRRLKERVIRLAITANGRFPWTRLFFDGSLDTPLTQARAGEFEQALEAVRRAPSASNKQPWRVVMADDGATFHFFFERGMGLDRGIAVLHFDLATAALGLNGTWAIKDPGVVLPEGTKYTITWKRE